jgi:beta-glucosidase
MRGLSLFAAASVPTLTVAEEGHGYSHKYVVSAFQDDEQFVWGAATAAAQIEGAAEVDGKQRSIWDDFCDSIPAQTGDTSTVPFNKTCGQVPKGGDPAKWTTLNVTDDFYNKYEEDLEMLAGYNMNAMRVSISWPRLMPFDKKTGKHKLNRKGKEFYTKVFKSMKEKGITPFVTLFHWDLPNDLSWVSTPSVVEAFADYAEVAFKSFPEVKNWVTFNEPNSVCSLGYAVAAFAPGHASKHGHIDCAHNILKSHAKAVERYRSMQLGGKIGIVLDYKWAYPEDPDSDDDNKAAKLDIDNVLGVWAEPIFVSGDYPQSMRDYYGSALGTFTDAEQMSLKGSADFFGLNTYGGKKAKWTNKTYDEHEDGDDMAERYTYSPCDENGHPGAKDALKDPAFECGAASSWLWAKPEAIYDYLTHVSQVFGVKDIYVTEFGVDLPEEGAMTVEESVKDHHRVHYYQRFLMQIAKAKKSAKVGVRGVFAWSLMDNFEWGDGLNFRFGITYVDFNSDALTRTPKDSAKFWKHLIGDMKKGGKEYEQCGGKEFHGSTKCLAELVCVKQNDYYSQCRKPTETIQHFITV